MKKMSRNKFEQMFGFCLPKPLTKTEHQRAVEIRRLFDDMQDTFGMRSREVFRAAGMPEMHASFISVADSRSVLTCPGRVLAFCQQALAPGSRERNALAKRQ